MASRYLIGIDLGTTNCALSYLDTQEKPAVTRVLGIPQLIEPGMIRELPILPSFVYLPPESGSGEAGLESGEVGVFAREQAVRQPGRVIHSAKSWLCQTGDPQARILPWGSADVPADEKLSPIAVSARYLSELRGLWDRTLGRDGDVFADQDVTLTVPASFDEGAQYATLSAAEIAGFPKKTRLLEEPQAAFYAFLESREGETAVRALRGVLPELDRRAQTILVCDIGGGTTDFSLFETQPPAPRQRIPRIRRIAVSDHLLLGGDNIDWAIAHRIESKLAVKLGSRQWGQLVAEARRLKERALSGEDDPETVYHLAIASAGSRLLQATLTAQVACREIRELVENGFFPEVSAQPPAPQTAHSALREWGLKFAADTAVPRHLAAFLRGREVDAVLFNGGTLVPAFLQERLRAQIALWQNGRVPVLLPNREMDLAVARGAAHYGAVLRRATGRIRGGYPHSVYLEVARENRFEAGTFVCLLPRGFETGDRIAIDSLAFKLLVDQPVQFQLFYSNSRGDDAAGAVVARDESFRELPRLQTRLQLPPGSVRPADGKLDIRLHLSLGETGLLVLDCVRADGPERWRLDFNLRRAEGAGTAAQSEPSSGIAAGDTGVDPARLARAQERIALFYGKKKISGLEETPKALKSELESILGRKREDWNLALLRALWTPLADGVTRRVRSEAHEAVWLYLAGFCLRPGYGSELDRWRIAELWRAFAGGPAFPKSTVSRGQWWILWRRVAGGLDAEQQSQVWQRIAGLIRSRPDVPPEVLLLAGSLERLEPPIKAELGQCLLRRASDRKATALDPIYWALGRLSSRFPIYAGLGATVDPAVVQGWVEAVLALPERQRRCANLNLFLSQACTLTGDRHRDIDPAVRRRALAVMEISGASEDQLRRLQVRVADTADEQASLFGERLPAGLQLSEPAA